MIVCNNLQCLFLAGLFAGKVWLYFKVEKPLDYAGETCQGFTLLAYFEYSKIKVLKCFIILGRGTINLFMAVINTTMLKACAFVTVRHFIKIYKKNFKKTHIK